MRRGAAKKGGHSATIAPMLAGRPPRRDKRHGSRPEHGAERQKREEAARPHASAQRPDKRAQKAIDPDNPFAKLMALKAQMEEEGQR